MGVLALAAGGLAVAGTGFAIHQNRMAVGAQEAELVVAQREEAAAARDREVQRKRRVNALLGAQAADAAARGLQMQGSVANITITDAKRAGEESFVDEVNTRARIDALSRRQRSVRRLGQARTATSILGLGERLIEIGA